ncbi:MFS transporter [Rhodospirillaceae bacterium SYSU D60014]|uniref:MFS transporter n=1 Tax=Virgifigura deserti TaxID=2268457 RepID=UPI000E673D90
MLAPDLRSEIRWLSSGFLLTLCSGFGQTYFIAIFAGYLKADLAMTDGQFGSLYTVGTLASAALLMWAGKFADKFSIRWLGVGVMAGLALTSLAMASVASAWMLALVLFGLRFFGQGMLTHVAMTAMGRWFNRKRGRAVSIAALGFPAGEAVLPLIAVTAIGLVGWRLMWVAAAVALVAVPVPVLIALLRRERTPTAGPAAPGDCGEDPVRRDWTRGEVLKSRLFYALMPGVLAQPFIATGIFFNQVTIVEMKGWELAWFAAGFPVLAGVSVLSALAAGWMVDRFGARRLLPSFLVPLGVAILILTYVTSPYVLPVFMALVGLTLGSSATIQGALWAELYGTRHLGAIRAFATAGMVFSTALSPGLIGILMDAGVALEAQFLAMAAYCFIAALWMGSLMPRLNRLAAA